MSIDANIPERIRKRSAMWSIAAAAFVLLLLFAYQLLGPNPTIRVSRETTFITDPLRADGLPDYKQFALNIRRAGIKPADNAAVLLWYVLPRTELSASDAAIVAKELHADEISPYEPLTTLWSDGNRQAVARWLNDNGRLVPPGAKIDADSIQQVLDRTSQLRSDQAEMIDDYVDEMISHITLRLWTSSDCPPLASWLKKNQPSIDILVAASQQPKYYAPSLSLLSGDTSVSLVADSSVLSESIRHSTWILCDRAMWQLGEGRVMEGWQDLFALHRLCQLLGNSNDLNDRFVGCGMSFLAVDYTLTLLDQESLTLEQARKIRSDTESLHQVRLVSRDFDQLYRLAAIDSLVQLSSGDELERPESDDVSSPTFIGRDILSIDWNVILSSVNQRYDSLSALAQLPGGRKRAAAIADFEADVQQKSLQNESLPGFIGSVLSRQRRSRAAASVLLPPQLEYATAAVTTEDRANVRLDMLRLAAALAAFRAQHGAYPDRLAQIVPELTSELPVDLYGDKPYAYRRIDEGYLLYSVGENGQDDGGSHDAWEVVEGRQSDERTPDDESKPAPPPDADDIAVRLPRVPPKPPQLAPEPSPPER